MKTINYGYLYTFGTTFIIADGIILALKGVDTFFWYLLLFQSLIIIVYLLFSFKIVDYSKKGILIRNPFRMYSAWIYKEDVDFFIFRHIHGARYSGIDLYIQLKLKERKPSFLQRIKSKQVLKYYVSKQDVITLKDWFKENGYNMKFVGNFDTINF